MPVPPPRDRKAKKSPRSTSARAGARKPGQPVRRRGSQTAARKVTQGRSTTKQPSERNANKPERRGSPTLDTTGQRLQKVLSAAGIASRRAAEDLIRQGRVVVNGKIADVLGTRVDPVRDRIEIDGRRIATDPAKTYLVLNKPAGVVTTMRDERGRPAVAGLVPAEPRVYPVGRLDADTQGLLLFTNDGELAHRLAHPRYGIDRVYRAEVTGTVTRPVIERLLAGVPLEDGLARAVSARIVTISSRSSHVEIVMREGRKREVRRMLDAVGHRVERLVRRRFGPIALGALPAGTWRYLTQKEIGALYEIVDL